MRKALALTVFLAMAPYANAQDAAKSDFSHNAEFRARYQFDQNINASKDLGAESQSNFNHRFKLGTQFKASDKLSANLTLLHRAVWGTEVANAATDGAEGTAAGIANNQNMILVQEAYGTWMMSDEFSLKFGRGGFTMGDGSLISANDWEQDPTTFEGVLGTYEMEAGKLNVFFVRFAELTGAPGATADDPEANAYGLSWDFKTLPAFLSAVNIHVLQTKKDATTAALGESQLRYGLSLAGAASMVDYKANYEGHSGERSNDTDKKGMMWQAEVGVNFEEFMKSRLYFLYHQDSGTGTGTTDDETYDNFYYEKHNAAGMMDVLGWGNLTKMSVGYTLEPMDATNVGLHYHMFSRTEEASGVTAGINGAMFGTFTPAQTWAGTEKKIGDEIDLVASHSYDNGLTITGWAGMFMPGAYLKDAAPTEQKDTYTQVFLEAKMTF